MGAEQLSLSIFRYQSQFTGAGEQQTLEGALFRAEDRPDESVACLQPWPGLGDPTLDQLLKELMNDSRSKMPQSHRSPDQHPLLRNALAALRDTSFKPDTLALYEQKQLQIPTHVLIQKDDSKEKIRTLLSEGVNRFKIKLRKEYDFCSGAFEHLRDLQDQFFFQIRFDANATTSKEEFLDCWKRLESLQSLVEFVEDPCPFDRDNWKSLEELGVPIANDRPLHFQKPEELTEDFPCKFLVMKPVRHNLNDWKQCFQNSGKKVVLTTALDHPWGQLWAFHSYLKLREEGITLEHGGFATDTLTADSFNPLKREGDQVRIQGLEKLLRETEEYSWKAL